MSSSDEAVAGPHDVVLANEEADDSVEVRPVAFDGLVHVGWRLQSLEGSKKCYINLTVIKTRKPRIGPNLPEFQVADVKCKAPQKLLGATTKTKTKFLSENSTLS